MSVLNLNFDEVCRLCLRTNDYITFIFSEMYLKDRVSLAERINKISSVKICVDDGLPLSICSGCKKKVDDCYEFQEQIVETESILRQCVKLKLGKANETVSRCREVIDSKSEIDTSSSHLKLVCVEPDGTQVFTVDENIMKLEDSVEILPISRESREIFSVKPYDTNENSVVVFSNKSINAKDGVPLNLLSLVQSSPAIDCVNTAVTNSLIDNQFKSQSCSSKIKAEKIEPSSENKVNACKNHESNFDSRDCSNKTMFSDSKVKLKQLKQVNKRNKHDNKAQRTFKTFKSTKPDRTCEVSCQLCLEQFQQYDDLQIHINSHFDGFHMFEALTEDASDVEDSDEHINTHSKSCNYCFRKVPEHKLAEHIANEHHDFKHTCKHCSASFETCTEMKEHVKLNHYSLQCTICSTPTHFASYLQMQSHLSAVHYNGAFWCTPCSKSFSQKYDFIIHQRRHLGIRPFKCKQCTKQFVTATLCKEHERRHAKDAPYLCKFCGKSYIRISELKTHEKTVHITNGPITCQVCLKIFSNMPSFKLHSKRHEIGLRFICNTCGKAYYSNSELQRHEQIHSGLRRYPCNLCENSFMSQPELNRHLKYHNGEKKYKCAECGKCYYESGHLRVHERSHTGVKPYECQICFKRFVARPKLMRHLKIHNQNKLSKLPVDFTENKNQIPDVTSTVFIPTEDHLTSGSNTNNPIVISDNGVTEEMLSESPKSNSDMLANIIEIDDYNQVINMDNVIVDGAGNMFEMQMSDGSIVIMENGETLVNDNELLYTSIQDNVKIEIIDS